MVHGSVSRRGMLGCKTSNLTRISRWQQWGYRSECIGFEIWDTRHRSTGCIGSERDHDMRVGSIIRTKALDGAIAISKRQGR